MNRKTGQARTETPATHGAEIVREYGPPIAWFRDPAGNVLSVIKLD